LCIDTKNCNWYNKNRKFTVEQMIFRRGVHVTIVKKASFLEKDMSSGMTDN